MPGEGLIRGLDIQRDWPAVEPSSLDAMAAELSPFKLLGDGDLGDHFRPLRVT